MHPKINSSGPPFIRNTSFFVRNNSCLLSKYPMTSVPLFRGAQRSIIRETSLNVKSGLHPAPLWYRLTFKNPFPPRAKRGPAQFDLLFYEQLLQYKYQKKFPLSRYAAFRFLPEDRAWYTHPTEEFVSQQRTYMLTVNPKTNVRYSEEEAFDKVVNDMREKAYIWYLERNRHGSWAARQGVKGAPYLDMLKDLEYGTKKVAEKLTIADLNVAEDKLIRWCEDWMFDVQQGIKRETMNLHQIPEAFDSQRLWEFSERYPQFRNCFHPTVFVDSIDLHRLAEVTEEKQLEIEEQAIEQAKSAKRQANQSAKEIDELYETIQKLDLKSIQNKIENPEGAEMDDIMKFIDDKFKPLLSQGDIEHFEQKRKEGRLTEGLPLYAEQDIKRMESQMEEDKRPLFGIEGFQQEDLEKLQKEDFDITKDIDWKKLGLGDLTMGDLSVLFGDAAQQSTKDAKDQKAVPPPEPKGPKDGSEDLGIFSDDPAEIKAHPYKSKIREYLGITQFVDLDSDYPADQDFAKKKFVEEYQELKQKTGEYEAKALEVEDLVKKELREMGIDVGDTPKDKK